MSYAQCSVKLLWVQQHNGYLYFYLVLFIFFDFMHKLCCAFVHSLFDVLLFVLDTMVLKKKLYHVLFSLGHHIRHSHYLYLSCCIYSKSSLKYAGSFLILNNLKNHSQWENRLQYYFLDLVKWVYPWTGFIRGLI